MSYKYDLGFDISKRNQGIHSESLKVQDETPDKMGLNEGKLVKDLWIFESL